MSTDCVVVSNRFRLLMNLGVVVALFVGAITVTRPLLAQEPTEADEDEGASSASDSDSTKTKFADFAATVKGAQRYEGLFTLYHKNEHLYAEIKPDQYNKMLLAPMAIARGMASAGTPLNFGDEWVLVFRRVGDSVQLVRKNVHYEAPDGSPLEKAVQQNFTDSVLMALPIVSINPGNQAAVIDFSNIFFTNFANLPLGGLDRSRTSWHKIKAFPNNVELQVEATFTGGGGASALGVGDDGVIDPRGVTLILHYSLAVRPDSGYKPRFADQRVGHFISATQDFGTDQPDTTFVRRINRWHLEKADPSATLSPPKEQLIWWVEDTVPHEYRPFVEEGILEWNKAFQKIGFRNAIGVRWQNDRDEFDPEDINYCTFRWITTPYTFAMSGLRADPITGEMIDGDVIFDASWIRAWKEEYALLVGKPMPSDQSGAVSVLGVGEIISPMMAVKHGYGLPFHVPALRSAGQSSTGQELAIVPSTHGPLHTSLMSRLTEGRFTACQCAVAKRHEYRLAMIAMATEESDDEEAKNGDESSDEKTEEKSKETEVTKLPDELIGQAIKEVVMHEVGHSLGLRHNFKASAMLTLEQINDPSITREKGMVGSVMDYNPLNISRQGQKQGDYATTTLGPYDYWAIEYAYKPIDGDEAEELTKIAARSPEAELLYATDEDLYLSNDPLVNAFDLGQDPLAYARDRLVLASELLQNLDQKVVKDGESWARLRTAFSVLLGQFGNSAYLASAFIGGQHVSRDFKGGEDSHDPITPVSGEKQRGALEFLTKEILGDQAFVFSPQLLRRLGSEHWYHWGSQSMLMANGSDYNIFDRILAIQSIVLDHCFDASVLRRLQNQQLLVESSGQALSIAEVFSALTDCVWSELKTEPSGDAELSCSTIRRNLQRSHLQRLCRIVIGDRASSYSSLAGYIVLYGGDSSFPADARSLACVHLTGLDRQLSGVLDNPERKIDATTRAHFEESRNLIRKVLAAEIETGRI